MMRSFVVRLVAGRSGMPELVGEIEDVTSGEHRPIANGDELLALLGQWLAPMRPLSGPEGESPNA